MELFLSYQIILMLKESVGGDIMSKKDFDLEFKQIEQQYTEMVNNLREMEKEMNEGLVEPEFVERLRSIVDPIIVNYKVWDYIRFILNKPVKKDKKERYIKQNEHLLADKNVTERMKKENEEALCKMKEEL